MNLQVKAHQKDVRDRIPLVPLVQIFLAQMLLLGRLRTFVKFLQSHQILSYRKKDLGFERRVLARSQHFLHIA